MTKLQAVIKSRDIITDIRNSTFSFCKTTDVILILGQFSYAGMALWRGILTRAAEPNPPAIIVMDSQESFPYFKTSVHLTPKPGSYHTVISGILNLVIQSGYINEESVKKKLVGFEQLVKAVSGFTPQKVQKISGVPVRLLMNSAEIIGNTRSMLTAVGCFEQSDTTVLHVNNLHLIRGLNNKNDSGIIRISQTNAYDLNVFRFFDFSREKQPRIWRIEVN